MPTLAEIQRDLAQLELSTDPADIQAAAQARNQIQALALEEEGKLYRQYAAAGIDIIGTGLDKAQGFRDQVIANTFKTFDNLVADPLSRGISRVGETIDNIDAANARAVAEFDVRANESALNNPSSLRARARGFFGTREGAEANLAAAQDRQSQLQFDQLQAAQTPRTAVVVPPPVSELNRTLDQIGNPNAVAINNALPPEATGDVNPSVAQLPAAQAGNPELNAQIQALSQFQNAAIQQQTEFAVNQENLRRQAELIQLLQVPQSNLDPAQLAAQVSAQPPITAAPNNFSSFVQPLSNAVGEVKVPNAQRAAATNLRQQGRTNQINQNANDAFIKQQQRALELAQREYAASLIPFYKEPRL